MRKRLEHTIQKQTLSKEAKKNTRIKKLTTTFWRLVSNQTHPEDLQNKVTHFIMSVWQALTAVGANSDTMKRPTGSGAGQKNRTGGEKITKTSVKLKTMGIFFTTLPLYHFTTLPLWKNGKVELENSFLDCWVVLKKYILGGFQYNTKIYFHQSLDCWVVKAIFSKRKGIAWPEQKEKVVLYLQIRWKAEQELFCLRSQSSYW